MDYLVSGVWEDELSNKWSYLVTTADYLEFEARVISSGGKIIKKVILDGEN